MKKLTALLLAILIMISFSSCGAETSTEGTVSEAVTDTAITAKESTGEFTVTTEDGTYSGEDGVYTISSAGTYTLKGSLE